MGGHRAHRGSHVYPHLISLICTDCHGEDQGGDHTPPMASCCSFTQEEWLECYKKGGQPRMLHLKPSSASRRGKVVRQASSCTLHGPRRGVAGEKYCAELGLGRELTAPYSPQQNGVVRAPEPVSARDCSEHASPGRLLGRGGHHDHLPVEPLIVQWGRWQDPLRSLERQCFWCSAPLGMTTPNLKNEAGGPPSWKEL